MYNWMARSQALITWRRLLVGTLGAALVPYCLLGLHATLVVWAATLSVTAASIYYAQAILGGVVGDYIGATVQIAELSVYLALTADWGALWQPEGWRPVVGLMAAVLPVVAWCRQIVDFC
jgi:cobalamin synthase